MKPLVSAPIAPCGADGLPSESVVTPASSSTARFETDMPCSACRCRDTGWPARIFGKRNAVVALITATLSLFVAVTGTFAAAAGNPDNTVHIMVDASASFAQVDLSVAAAMRKVALPSDMRFEVLRWDTNLVPGSAQDWPAEGPYQLPFGYRGGGTQLGQSLQELLAQTRKARETCTRVVIVVHGETYDEAVLKTTLASARPYEFIKLLMAPLEAPSEGSDPETVLKHYQQMIDGFAPLGTPPAEAFSATTFGNALNAAYEHRCLLRMM